MTNQHLTKVFQGEYGSIEVPVLLDSNQVDGQIVVKLDSEEKLVYSFQAGQLRELQRLAGKSIVYRYQFDQGLGHWQEPVKASHRHSVNLKGYHYQGLNVVRLAGRPTLVYAEDGLVYPLAVIKQPLMAETTVNLRLASDNKPVTVYHLKLLIGGTDLEVKASKLEGKVVRSLYINGHRHSLTIKNLIHYRTSYTLPGLKFDLLGWHLLAADKLGVEPQPLPVNGLVELASLQDRIGFEVETRLQTVLE